jgi:spore maturation protein CgeB
MQDIYRTPDEIYLPYAADDTVHYPMPEVNKVYDACLIGLQYPTRNELVARLRSHGLSVKYMTGEVFDEYRLSYNQSKIALNWSTLNDVPARFFEGMAMKLPMVSNIVPDIEKLGFIEGKDFMGFLTVDEADGKVKQLLVDEGLRSWVAENGYKKVMEKHLWKHRAKQILETAKLI